MHIEWGNDLRELARRMFERLDGEAKTGAEELFSRRDLIAAANRVQLGWLKLEAMYRNKQKRVWTLRETATVDEIAERIVQKGRGGGRWREAAQWPLFRLLGRFGGAPGAYLERLGGEGGRGAEARRWRLAGRLARLFEDYQNYRPKMIGDWSRGAGTDGVPEWELELWLALRKEMGEATLWDAYRDLPGRVAAAAEKSGWRRVEVFGTSLLSPVQMAVFLELGKHLEVTVSLFNPAKGDWFDLPRNESVLDGWTGAVIDRPEELEWGKPEKLHPLLSRNGIGARDTVAVALDLTGGNVPEDKEGAWLEGGKSDLERFSQPCDREAGKCDILSRPNGLRGWKPHPPNNGGNDCGISKTALGRLQEEIEKGTAPEKMGEASVDESIRVLQAHGKMREAEAVREEILRAFDELDGLEPMDVQVQVAGLEDYAPYLEAVFGGGEIPFAMEGGTGAGPETVRAFLQLLDAATGRFAATELLSLLRTEPVRRKLKLDEQELRAAERLVKASGIRWGADAAHHGEELEKALDIQRGENPRLAFPECSWDYGLERLLLGYAMGEEVEAGGVRGCDIAEGEDAETAGTLAGFVRRLAGLREEAKKPRTAAGWRKLLSREFERGFDGKGDEHGADAVRQTLARLEELAEESGCAGERVGFEVAREQLQEVLGAVREGANLEGNAIQINELRPGSSTPRRVQVVMGLESGQFPGGETRAAYDLLRPREGRRGRMGDRNPTRESRAAFLECLMSARERLVLAYPAWSERDLSAKPAAGPLVELEDYLKRGGKEPGVQIIKHKLHGYSPEYFQKKGNLVSHSAGDRAAAAVLVEQRHAGGAEAEEAGSGAGTAAEGAEGEAVVDLEKLIRFFQNPAKARWEGLGVYWRPSEDEAGDSEAFRLDPLQDSRLKKAGLDALQAAGEAAGEEGRAAAVKTAVEAAYARMQEAGDAPLGREKERLVDETVNKVTGMPTAWDKEVEPLKIALWTKGSPMSAETEVDVEGRKVRVTGTLAVGEDKVQALARCAKPKAKVRMEMWVKHLLGVAAERVTRTCVAQVVGAASGKQASQRQVDDWSAAGLDPEAAKEKLGEWVKVYMEGQGRAVPFSPEASAKFTEGAEADKVLKAWEEDYDGGKDAYQMREFGRKGPMKDEGFERLARGLMGKIPTPVMGAGVNSGKDKESNPAKPKKGKAKTGTKKKGDAR